MTLLSKKKSTSSAGYGDSIAALSLAELEYARDFFDHTTSAQSTPPLQEITVDAVINQIDDQPKHTLSHKMNDDDMTDDWLQQQAQRSELPVDVIDTEQELIIVTTMPGIRAQDIEINLNGEVLTIQGERRLLLAQLPTDSYVLQECSWGDFSRSIILPSEVQTDKVTAQFEHGILMITLPKAIRSRHTKIEVVDLAANPENGSTSYS